MSSFLNPDPRDTRRSRLRLYFGVVGLLGCVAMAAELSAEDVELVWLIWYGAGVPLMLAYLLSALAFDRALNKGKLLYGVLGAFLAWLVALLGLMLWGGSTGELLPVLLFGVAPCLAAMMWLQDVRTDAGLA